ncbi:uncharacterized protein [Amphiura filiformis]|uniref:uncharacterized protein n=1 Tax=Amphiura filiformis TaxID=82378 RepID=UPI003B20B699
MWVSYLIDLKKVESHKEIELARLQWEKDVALQKLQTPAPVSADKVLPDKIRVPRLKDNEDIDVYLRAYELLAEANGWDKSKWATFLVPALSGKAKEAYANMSITDSRNYDALKAAILAKYQISAETYRVKFRSTERKPNQTVTEFMNDVKYFLEKWLQYSDISMKGDGDASARDIQDLLLIEQVLGKLPRDMAVYLRDRNLKESAALAREADAYVLHRGGTEYWKRKNDFKGRVQHSSAKSGPFRASSGQDGKTDKVCFRCQQPGHIGRECKQKENMFNSETKTCYACGQVGHIAPHCPKKEGRVDGHSSSLNGSKSKGGPNVKNAYNCQVLPGVKVSDLVSHVSDKELEARLEKCKVDGFLQGKAVRILRDSACTQSVVNAALITQDCYLDGITTKVSGIGGEVELPVAMVHIECCVLSGIVPIGVVEDLDKDVLLGHDLDPTCGEVLKRSVCVVTRAQAKQELDEFVEGELELQAHLADQVTQVVPGKRDGSDMSQVSSGNGLSVGRDTLCQQQAEDATLESVRQRVLPILDMEKQRVCFFQKDGLLMRKWERAQSAKRRAVRRQRVEQVVVPKQYRVNIMEMAHDNAGHMGVQKTKDRVLAHFYWPGVFQDIQRYCRTCDVCQRLDKGKQTRKAPLLPMPVIDVPFKRIGIDIVGPFERSRKRNMYLLTICDYTTRYPEAVPLTNIRAETVVDALVTVFARVGIPHEIVHDQGTNFMSKVMVSLCTKLCITQLKASVRHQQTNGMTERFHGTLKNMLRSLTTEQQKYWDEYIPYFLFAYREVPCQTTGYSPFELLYGRPIRGPLSILKQNWISPNLEENEVVSDLLEMRKRINNLIYEANENTRTNQRQMKLKKDKNAYEREFSPGDKILVFLPEGPSKLDNKWQGPYMVTQKLDKVNYEVELPDKGKSTRVFHINLCKKYFDRADAKRISQCMYVTGVVHDIGSTIDDEGHDEDIFGNGQHDDIGPIYRQTQSWHDVHMADDLTNERRQKLSDILEAHTTVFSDVPGKTHLVEHEIKTTSDIPVRQRAYRTPHALKDKVRAEINNMLQLGIIEPTTSAYASPIVVVAKPGGDIRLTTDFRTLNKSCDFDPYRMPRIDEILDEVANAKFISTLDLTKGFYQVPLSPASQAKSAFVCSFGQFCYKVLPFGLQNSSSTFQRLMDKVLLRL